MRSFGHMRDRVRIEEKVEHDGLIFFAAHSVPFQRRLPVHRQTDKTLASNQIKDFNFSRNV